MIAERWGFTNHGRLAVAYRDRFGEDPATTLRSARAARAGRASWRLRRAVAFIEEHLDEDLTLQAVADAAGVRPRRLQQLFLEERGESPMAAVRSIRGASTRNAADDSGDRG